MQPNHYEVLGVRSDADLATIRAAYLAAMRASHPDRHPGDLFAAHRARAVNAAWEVLRDPARRDAYDRTRRPAAGAAGTGARTARAQVERAVLRQAAATRRAYASTSKRFRRTFHLAALKVGTGIVLVGLVLLMLTNVS
jgi:curved DNA-binding protein CbpA